MSAAVKLSGWESPPKKSRAKRCADCQFAADLIADTEEKPPRCTHLKPKCPTCGGGAGACAVSCGFGL